MLMGLWVIALVIFVGVWLLYWLEDGRGHGSANEYRQKYIRLIDRVETVVGLANKLEPLAHNARDVKLLDVYLGHLRMLETIMGAVRTMSPFGVSSTILQAPAFLINDVHDRFKQFETQLDNHLKGKPVKLDNSIVSADPGCYFCSRPFDPAQFHKVRVKIDGNANEVTACKTCRDRLISGKKARVLFFDEEGRAVHWSKAKGYTPAERYWSINADQAVNTGFQTGLGTGTHLTLVHSSVSPLTSQSKLD